MLLVKRLHESERGFVKEGRKYDENSRIIAV
jgi:hypothetical protein